MKDKIKISLFWALCPILFLIGMLALNIYYFGDDTLSGSNQVTLIFSTALAIVIAMMHGVKWKPIMDNIIKNISFTVPSIVILMLIGALAGTWMISGIVPTMIYYGLKFINPGYFLVACVLVSALVSLGTGSSWTTIATIGVALLTIGTAMGFSPAVVGGAIISGAYFGDKISPMSDTTNLASAVSSADLFVHIRYMMQTTIPSILISIVIFFFIGLGHSDFDSKSINSILTELDTLFYISPILLIVPLLVILLIIRKIETVQILFIAIILAAIFAIIFQAPIIETIAAEHSSYGEASYIACMKAIYGSIELDSPIPSIQKLLSTSGMAGMMNTIWLIITAMVFSGAMGAANMFETIANSILSLAKKQHSLIGSTIATCLFLNTSTSDQYLSIVIGGQMFKEAYDKKGYKPEVLSRTIEDSATVTSVLVPWNTCGATQAAVLGIPTLVFAPFCFFCIISPIMSFLLALFNIGIRKIKPN